MEQISRSTKMPYMQVVRANIILQAGNGERNAHIAQDISCNVNTVRTWRERWAEAVDTLAEAEAEMAVKEYRQMVNTSSVRMKRRGDRH